MKATKKTKLNFDLSYFSLKEHEIKLILCDLTDNMVITKLIKTGHK